MRDQSNRSNQSLKEEANYTKNVDRKINQPRFPSWDSEELDLTARYQRVEGYTPVFEQEVIHDIKDKS